MKIIYKIFILIIIFQHSLGNRNLGLSKLKIFDEERKIIYFEPFNETFYAKILEKNSSSICQIYQRDLKFEQFQKLTLPKDLKYSHYSDSILINKTLYYIINNQFQVFLFVHENNLMVYKGFF